jgi:hypothetical protein
MYLNSALPFETQQQRTNNWGPVGGYTKAGFLWTNCLHFAVSLHYGRNLMSWRIASAWICRR